MWILTVADGHGCLVRDEIELAAQSKPVPDVILFLGDNDYWDLEMVASVYPHVPKYGILGNHDMCIEGKQTVLDEAGIPNVHLKIVECNGIKIGGFEGSIRYKPSGSHPLYTNQESIGLLADFPYCDVFVTHSPSLYFEPDVITSHTGLLGVGQYIREKRPQLHLYGHLHKRENTMYMATTEKCCYGLEWQKFLFVNEMR
jgi:Icc-related predicted phosphoesterase